MPTIILDVAAYQRRSGTIPPKKGPVEASFVVADTIYTFKAFSFDIAVEYAKQRAREHGVYTITLQNVSRANE